MNEIVNKILLAGDKSLPEMYLNNQNLLIVLVDPLLKVKKIKETGHTKYIYKNDLDKAGFQYDMTYRDFKDLARRTASGKVFKK